VAVARGNEKGRVERAIRFVRDRFFAARRYTDVADLNAQALAWCSGEAAARPCPEDRTRSVRECFEEERPRLLALPDDPFPSEERVVVRVHKTPYARFDWNDYSVPHTHVRRTLEVRATPDTVRILDAGAVIATHPRSYDRDEQVEDPPHIKDLADQKRSARRHRAMDRLHHAAPSGAKFFAAAALRGVHLGALTRGLIDLLDTHGAAALEAALLAALAEDSAHLAAVRHFIDLHRARRGARPPIPVHLPDDPRVRALNVRPHNLTDYEQLTRKDSHERIPEDALAERPTARRACQLEDCLRACTRSISTGCWRTPSRSATNPGSSACSHIEESERAAAQPQAPSGQCTARQLQADRRLRLRQWPTELDRALLEELLTLASSSKPPTSSSSAPMA
jgi:hypothetical protein